MEVIRVENLSKLYDLGQVGTGTISKDLNRWWSRVRSKEDPYSKIGQLNDRTKKAGKEESVWALKDINFSVNQGDVVGVIGRNGAGKSTLLKIVSRITTPTTGSVKVRGRIASLLEVGTGFHPEMTGRENVFMNGTLLGMSKREIQSKLEEIIDFAGVALYIDTPVKRYSSGMQVRLAFAVAAFLEPEILIVDEVLAVGDAEFQKKAIGRMKEVSQGDGRTVLFVSHNMTAIKSLCKSAIIISKGSIVYNGDVNNAVDQYLVSEDDQTHRKFFATPELAPGNDFVRVKRLEAVPRLPIGQESITVQTPVDIEFEFWNFVADKMINLSMHVYTRDGVCVFNWGTVPRVIGKGLFIGVCRIPENLLNSNVYYVTMMIVAETSYALYNFEDGVAFEVHENRIKSGWHGKWPGLLRPNLEFTLEVAQ